MDRLDSPGSPSEKLAGSCHGDATASSRIGSESRWFRSLRRVSASRLHYARFSFVVACWNSAEGTCLCVAIEFCS